MGPTAYLRVVVQLPTPLMRELVQTVHEGLHLHLRGLCRRSHLHPLGAGWHHRRSGRAVRAGGHGCGVVRIHHLRLRPPGNSGYVVLHLLSGGLLSMLEAHLVLLSLHVGVHVWVHVGWHGRLRIRVTSGQSRSWHWRWCLRVRVHPLSRWHATPIRLVRREGVRAIWCLGKASHTRLLPAKLRRRPHRSGLSVTPADCPAGDTAGWAGQEKASRARSCFANGHTGGSSPVAVSGIATDFATCAAGLVTRQRHPRWVAVVWRALPEVLDTAGAVCRAIGSRSGHRLSDSEDGGWGRVRRGRDC